MTLVSSAVSPSLSFALALAQLRCLPKAPTSLALPTLHLHHLCHLLLVVLHGTVRIAPFPPLHSRRASARLVCARPPLLPVGRRSPRPESLCPLTFGPASLVGAAYKAPCYCPCALIFLTTSSRPHQDSLINPLTCLRLPTAIRCVSSSPLPPLAFAQSHGHRLSTPVRSCAHRSFPTVLCLLMCVGMSIQLHALFQGDVPSRKDILFFLSLERECAADLVIRRACARRRCRRLFVKFPSVFAPPRLCVLSLSSFCVSPSSSAHPAHSPPCRVSSAVPFRPCIPCCAPLSQALPSLLLPLTCALLVVRFFLFFHPTCTTGALPASDVTCWLFVRTSRFASHADRTWPNRVAVSPPFARQTLESQSLLPVLLHHANPQLSDALPCELFVFAFALPRTISLASFSPPTAFPAPHDVRRPRSRRPSALVVVSSPTLSCPAF